MPRAVLVNICVTSTLKLLSFGELIKLIPSLNTVILNFVIFSHLFQVQRILCDRHTKPFMNCTFPELFLQCSVSIKMGLLAALLGPKESAQKGPAAAKSIELMTATILDFTANRLKEMPRFT